MILIKGRTHHEVLVVRAAVVVGLNVAAQVAVALLAMVMRMTLASVHPRRTLAFHVHRSPMRIAWQAPRLLRTSLRRSMRFVFMVGPSILGWSPVLRSSLVCFLLTGFFDSISITILQCILHLLAVAIRLAGPSTTGGELSI